jgi:hypothetical protein
MERKEIKGSRGSLGLRFRLEGLDVKAKFGTWGSGTFFTSGKPIFGFRQLGPNFEFRGADPGTLQNDMAMSMLAWVKASMEHKT